MAYYAGEQQDETWMECLRGGAIRLGLGILIGGAASVVLASETPIILGSGIGGILAVTNCNTLYKEKEECEEDDEEEMDLSCFGGGGKKENSEPSDLCEDDIFDSCVPCQEEDELEDPCDDFDDQETYAVHKEDDEGEKYLCAPEKMLDTEKYVFFKCKPVSEIQDDVNCPCPCEDRDN